MSILLIFAGIILTASAQIFLKLAGFQDINNIRWYLLIISSVVSYGISFAVYAVILKLYPISKVAPAMTVGTVVLVVFFGVITG
jgi:drug/metabolite transporter (DMT)-like permease